MAKDAGEVWRNYFSRWPADLERRGVLVTSFGEQILFEDFATSDDMLALERRTPDTLGGRTVLIAFQHIEALKIVDVVKLRSLQSAGFQVSAGRTKRSDA